MALIFSSAADFFSGAVFFSATMPVPAESRFRVADSDSDLEIEKISALKLTFFLVRDQSEAADFFQFADFPWC